MHLLLKRLEHFTNRIQLPLRWKFMIPIFLLVCLLGIWSLILVRSYMFRQFVQELEKRGLYITQMLAERSTPHILYENQFQLQDLLSSFPNADPDIAYAMLLRRNGSVMAHTFAGGFPADLMEVHPRQLQEPHTKRVRDGNVYLLDVAVPILGGRAGVARVGLYEWGVWNAAKQSTQRLSLLLLLALLLGLLASFVLARLISHPIVQLSQVMQETELDIKLPRLPAHMGDEIGVLIEQFNSMVERLQQAHLRLKDIQQQVLQAQKLEAISELAAGVAHEINNPIDGIRNGLEAIRRGSLSPERQVLYFEMIDEAVQRIETVVRDLAEHVRHQDVHFDELDLISLLDHCLKLVQETLDEFGISVSRPASPDFAWVVGSQFALEQAFVNLIRNAIDAMPTGGILTLSVHQCMEDDRMWREVAGRTDDAEESQKQESVFVDAAHAVPDICWIVEIQDTGIGISEQQLPRLFDPFFTTKKSHRARGLGLWVTQGLIEMHRGGIEIESEEFQGTTCRVFLPRKEDDNESDGRR